MNEIIPGCTKHYTKMEKITQAEQEYSAQLPQASTMAFPLDKYSRGQIAKKRSEDYRYRICHKHFPTINLFTTYK